MVSNHHESLVIVQQHQKEIAQSYRAANRARPRRVQLAQTRQISLRLPRWRIRFIMEPIMSAARYNSVSQPL